MLNNSVLFQQHLQGQQPLQSADWGSFRSQGCQWSGGCQVNALTLLRVSTAREGLTASGGKFQTQQLCLMLLIKLNPPLKKNWGVSV